MSSSESTSAPRKRSTSATEAKAAEPAAAAAVESYEDALDKGYLGGPADETDYTVAASAAPEAGE
jgi:hypothetical protein